MRSGMLVLCCALIWPRTWAEAGTDAPALGRLVDEQRIIERLLADNHGRGYDWRMRPRGSLDPDGPDGPVDIAANMYLRSISEVDDVNMEFNLHFTFREEWVDERLLFFSPHHKHIVLSGDQHRRRTTRVWTPDTFFQNEKNGKKHSVDLPNVMIRIHNGTARVLYSCRLTLTLSCPMHLAAYPLDVQTCYIDYASYAYTSQEILYRWKEVAPVQIKAGLHQSLPSFTLSEVSVGNCTSVTNTGTYSCLRTVLKLKREFSYYLLQLYVPSFMLVLVSTISFWLDGDSVAARVTLGVTVLLTVTTMASGINANLPPVSYTKSVDIWIGVCTGFIFGALLEFALVNWALHKDIKYKRRVQRHATSLLHMHTRHIVRPSLDDSSPAPNARSIMGMLQWFQLMNRLRHKEKSQKIDFVARIMFPMLFFTFNAIYWTYYLIPYVAVRSTTAVSATIDDNYQGAGMPRRADRMVGHVLGSYGSYGPTTRGPRGSVLVFRPREAGGSHYRVPSFRESRPTSRLSRRSNQSQSITPAFAADADFIPDIDSEDVDESRSGKLSVVDQDGEIVGEMVMQGGLTDLLQHTEIECVRHLNDDRTSTRWLWALVFVTFLLLAIYQIIIQVQLFLKTPISTNIEADYPAEVPFPVIAICNNNQYRLTYLTGKRLLERPRRQKQRSRNQSADVYDDALQAAWDLNAIKFLRNAAHWKTRMILDCRWPNGTSCTNSFRSVWTLTGLCWAINADAMKPVMVHGAGPSHGLRLLLNVERYERVESCTPTFKATSLPGLKIMIYNQNDSAISSLEGVNVPPGYSMDIPFRVQQTCVKETDEQRSTLLTSFDDPNNLRTCKIRKFLADVEYNCNCSLKHAYDPTGTERIAACNVEEYFNCVAPIKERGQELGFNQYNCETPCDQIDYIAWQDMNELPSNIFPKIIDTDENTVEEEEGEDELDAADEEEDTVPAETQQAIQCKEHQLLDEKQVAEVKLYAHRAYEKQSRYQQDIVIRTKRLIGRVNQTANRLIELQWGWKDEDFLGVHDRLHKYVQCYANMTDRHADVFAAVKSPASHTEEHRSQLLHQLVDPATYRRQPERFKTIADVKGVYGEKAETRLDEMTRMEDVLENLVFVYDRANFNLKLSEKLKRLDRILHLMQTYDKGLLQKRAWAEKMKSRNMVHFFEEDFYESWYNVIVKDLEQTVLKTIAFIEHTLPDLMSSTATGKGLDTGSVLLFGDTKQEHIRIFAHFMDDILQCTLTDVKNQTTLILEEFRKAMHNFQSAYTNLFRKELPEYLENFEFGSKFVRDNFAQVNVFLHKMNIEIWRQESTYSIWSLFCDIGGALGLFLGASLLTIMELIYICFQYGLCRRENIKPKNLKLYGKRAKQEVQHRVDLAWDWMKGRKNDDKRKKVGEYGSYESGQSDLSSEEDADTGPGKAAPRKSNKAKRYSPLSQIEEEMDLTLKDEHDTIKDKKGKKDKKVVNANKGKEDGKKRIDDKSSSSSNVPLAILSTSQATRPMDSSMDSSVTSRPDTVIHISDTDAEVDPSVKVPDQPKRKSEPMSKTAEVSQSPTSLLTKPDIQIPARSSSERPSEMAQTEFPVLPQRPVSAAATRSTPSPSSERHKTSEEDTTSSLATDPTVPTLLAVPSRSRRKDETPAFTSPYRPKWSDSYDETSSDNDEQTTV